MKRQRRVTGHAPRPPPDRRTSLRPRLPCQMSLLKMFLPALHHLYPDHRQLYLSSIATPFPAPDHSDLPKPALLPLSPGLPPLSPNSAQATHSVVLGHSYLSQAPLCLRTSVPTSTVPVPAAASPALAPSSPSPLQQFQKLPGIPKLPSFLSPLLQCPRTPLVPTDQGGPNLKTNLVLGPRLSRTPETAWGRGSLSDRSPDLPLASSSPSPPPLEPPLRVLEDL